MCIIIVILSSFGFPTSVFLVPVVVPDVASEEEEDAVAEVTEETKHEDTAPPPEVATHLTTEAPVVDTEVKAEVTEAEEEVVAEPSTSAPVAPLDAVVAPSEVQVNESAAAGEVTTEEVVVAGLTTAAEVAMETGSGEVARDNTSVVGMSTRWRDMRGMWHRCQLYRFRAENPAFLGPSRFPVKMSHFLCAYYALILPCICIILCALPVWNLKQRLHMDIPG